MHFTTLLISTIEIFKRIPTHLIKKSFQTLPHSHVVNKSAPILLYTNSHLHSRIASLHLSLFSASDLSIHSFYLSPMPGNPHSTLAWPILSWLPGPTSIKMNDYSGCKHCPLGIVLPCYSPPVCLSTCPCLSSSSWMPFIISYDFLFYSHFVFRTTSPANLSSRASNSFTTSSTCVCLPLSLSWPLLVSYDSTAIHHYPAYGLCP